MPAGNTKPQRWNSLKNEKKKNPEEVKMTNTHHIYIRAPVEHLKAKSNI